jgi:hypothetical protein
MSHTHKKPHTKERARQIEKAKREQQRKDKKSL